MQNGAATLEDSLAVSYETKLFSWDLVIKLLGIYPKELKTCPHKYLHMDVYSSFSHNDQNLETTKMSFSRWINK